MNIYSPTISGSLTISGSIITTGGGLPLTGSLVSSGSFTSIGPTVISGSLTVITGSSIEFQVLDTGVRIGNLPTDGHSITGSLRVSGSVTSTGATVVSGSFTVITGSTVELQVLDTGVRIGNLASDNHNVTGSLRISGSVTGSSFFTAGTITAQTLVVQTISSSVSFITGSTRFGSSSINTHQFTGSVLISGSSTAFAINNNMLFVSSSGNIGIGTTNPLGSSTERTLHLSDGGAGFTTLYVTNGANTLRGIFAVSNPTSTIAIGTQTNTDLRLVTNDSVKMTITSVGSIGIGTSTVTEGTQAAGSISIFPSSSVSSAPLIQFPGNGRIRPASTGDRLSIDGNALFLNSTFGSNIVMVTGGGNVGINNSGPTGRLHIGSDNTPTISGTTPTGAFVIQSTATTALTMGVFASNPFYGWMQMRHGALADLAYGLSIQPLGGNVGIGTTSPNHRLDVNGNINIPGTNQIVFNNEPTVWAIVARTTTTTANLGSALKNMLYCGGGANEGFAILGSGYAAAFEVNNNGNAWVRGTLTKGGGSFRIDHPLPEKKDTHYLYHSFIEGPKADLIYRGKINLINGTASVNIDEVSTMTEGTFELLTRDAQCFVNNLSGWDLVKGNITGNILTITSQNTESTDEISWMVVAERNDEWFRESEMTDNDGNTIVEKLKPIIE